MDLKEDGHGAESPGFLRMSLAAAMTLGFKPGLFYRNARLHCINLLLTYQQGCAARCAYCGLSRNRAGEYGRKSFIRVTWPTYPLQEIMERISQRRTRVKRICVSMITDPRALGDTERICSALRSGFDIPVSLLICPTILTRDDLVRFQGAGADKIGVAIDLATEELFDRYRGRSAGGPHRWKTYWTCLQDAIGIFGEGNAGSHFMVGMGESEEKMCRVIQKVRDMGGRTHLFSFFPEANSPMARYPIPSLGQYRRIQLARYLIDQQAGRAGMFSFDRRGRILDFGLARRQLAAFIDSGEPFRTSGCRGQDGRVACNRPFANSRPGLDIRNYPFPPEERDIQRIKGQMGQKINPAGGRSRMAWHPSG